MSIVRFTQVNSGYSFEIETVSENTIIVGENSTDVCSKLASGIDVGTITVELLYETPVWDVSIRKFAAI